MNRRAFLKATAAALAVPLLPPVASPGAAGAPPSTSPLSPDALARYFLEPLGGFLRNARATGRDYAVCDFPEGTKVAGCLTPGGKTYVSVARMLPALADYAAGPRGKVAVALDGIDVDLRQVLLSIYRTAFDPAHPDYWGEPPKDKPTQRTVESSLVAIALARLGPDFVSKLTPHERGNVNRWLASCTVVPERTNNHAWFTAVNQAARLKLSKAFPEFAGDEAWMLADLQAMDDLARRAAAGGWYSDDPKLAVYDYYNFWTFGNFPLFWSRVAGDLYADWDARFRARAKDFLQTVPYFFAADGSVPLFGRSLVYRWALLSPLLLGYQQGIWPHSPGLLRRVTRLNLAWWWDLGAYDAARGKLRETLSPDGTPDVREAYIDNGHPYWCMQSFPFLSFPAADPFWTAPEEPLPVERDDFLVRLPGPRMLLRGTKASGQVRWAQAQGTPRRDYYRDKYNKFVSSSAFPCNVLSAGRKLDPAAPWDQSLVFRDPATGTCAARIFPDSGELLGGDGVRTVWSARFPDGRTARVTSTVRLLPDDFELRTHDITLEGEATAKLDLEVCEGSHALGLAAGESPGVTGGSNWTAARSAAGHLLVSWDVSGHGSLDVATTFDPAKTENVNLVHARSAVVTLRRKLPGADTLRLASLHYASPKPLPMARIQQIASDIIRDRKIGS